MKNTDSVAENSSHLYDFLRSLLILSSHTEAESTSVCHTSGEFLFLLLSESVQS